MMREYPVQFCESLRVRFPHSTRRNIYVKSRRAGERVMNSITKFLEKKLKLKVNKFKSAVDRPWRRKFLGFSFYFKREGAGITVHRKSILRLKDRIRSITSRSYSISMENRVEKLNSLLRGWYNYFGIADMKRLANEIDQWTRRRLRMCYWKQWKKIKTKYDNLVRLGISNSKAWEYANTRKGYWRIALSWILTKSLNNQYFRDLGVISLSGIYARIH